MAVATGAGLAVVWAAAVAGALSHGRAKRSRRGGYAGSCSGCPRVLGAVAGAKLHVLVPERVTVGLFSLVLLIAALASPCFARSRRRPLRASSQRWKVVTVGPGHGRALTGFLGVGGGFLIVPALTLWAAAPAPASRWAPRWPSSPCEQSVWRGGHPPRWLGHVPLALVAPMGAGAQSMGAAHRAVTWWGASPRSPLKLGFALLALRGGRPAWGPRRCGLTSDGSDARIVCVVWPALVHRPQRHLEPPCSSRPSSTSGPSR
jgi:hypothetical protein